jgi:hypothetical protein
MDGQLLSWAVVFFGSLRVLVFIRARIEGRKKRALSAEDALFLLLPFCLWAYALCRSARPFVGTIAAVLLTAVWLNCLFAIQEGATTSALYSGAPVVAALAVTMWVCAPLVWFVGKFIRRKQPELNATRSEV